MCILNSHMRPEVDMCKEVHGSIDRPVEELEAGELPIIGWMNR